MTLAFEGELYWPFYSVLEASYYWPSILEFFFDKADTLPRTAKTDRKDPPASPCCCLLEEEIPNLGVSLLPWRLIPLELPAEEPQDPRPYKPSRKNAAVQTDTPLKKRKKKKDEPEKDQPKKNKPKKKPGKENLSPKRNSRPRTPGRKKEIIRQLFGDDPPVSE